MGNVGGLLGLFLGFSFISVVEVGYILAFGMDGAKSQRHEVLTKPKEKHSTLRIMFAIKKIQRRKKEMTQDAAVKPTSAFTKSNYLGFKY